MRSGFLFSKSAKFLLALLLQLLLVALVILLRLSILHGGTEVILRIAPVDPRDWLRGDYVTFQYDISTLDRALFTDGRIANGAQLFVLLAPRGSVWVAERVSVERPLESGAVFLAGRVVRGGRESAEDLGGRSLDVGRETAVSVQYGIEQYFIPEGSGTLPWGRNVESLAHVTVDRTGRGIVRSITVNGQPWPSKQTRSSTTEEQPQVILPVMSPSQSQTASESKESSLEEQSVSSLPASRYLPLDISAWMNTTHAQAFPETGDGYARWFTSEAQTFERVPFRVRVGGNNIAAFTPRAQTSSRSVSVDRERVSGIYYLYSCSGCEQAWDEGRPPAMKLRLQVGDDTYLERSIALSPWERTQGWPPVASFGSTKHLEYEGNLYWGGFRPDEPVRLRRFEILDDDPRVQLIIAAVTLERAQ